MPRSSDPNRCRASEVEDIRRSPQPRGSARFASPPARQIRPAAPPPSEESNGRLHEESSKLAIFQAYFAWVTSGKKKAQSPISALCTKYGCNPQYPKRLHDKVIQHGSIENKFKSARPAEFSPGCWERMVNIVRKSRGGKVRASTRSIAAALSRERSAQGKRAPGREAVRVHKNEAGFKTHKIKKKPRLTARLWQARLDTVKLRKCRSDKAYIKENECTIFADEKWFSEQKANTLLFDARDSSPVPANERFIEKDHETKTQQVKIMYMLAVTSKRTIGCYELDLNSWNATNQQKTKAGKVAKGITADFMRNILKQVGQDARKLLGRRAHITFLHDNASCYGALAKDGTLDGHFDLVEVAAGKAPDMSPTWTLASARSWSARLRQLGRRQRRKFGML
jgi:hypothetical protein